MEKVFQSVVLGVCLLTMSCNGNKSESSDQTADNSNNNKTEQTMKFQKKYTNADFYTDGKFNEDVAIKAYKEMLEFYGVPFTKFMDAEFWVAEFGLGDFENVGMGGIFWVNDSVHSYFAHAIYLLPGQMIPEHAHVRTEYAPKFESWMVNKGWAYNFSELGEATPGQPTIPAAHGPVKSKNFTIQQVGDIIHLKKEESFHFLMAGPEGAIVDEWASYHDGAGLRFTNPKASL
jgi:hypothetical protein